LRLSSELFAVFYASCKTLKNIETDKREREDIENQKEGRRGGKDEVLLLPGEERPPHASRRTTEPEICKTC
jgi:hypothetical protein